VEEGNGKEKKTYLTPEGVADEWKKIFWSKN